MYPVDARLLNPSGQAFQVTEWATVTSPAGADTATMETTGMSVSRDRTASVRTSCAVDLVGLEQVVPTDEMVGLDGRFSDGPDSTFGDGIFGDYRYRALQGLLLPGSTMRLWSKVTFADGTEQTVPQGFFDISKPQFSEGAGTISVSVSGADISARIAKAGFTAIHKVAPATNVRTAMAALLAARAPGVTLTAPSTAETIEGRLLFGKPGDSLNPWQALQLLAQAAGWEVFADRLGGVTAAPPLAVSARTASFELEDVKTAITTSRDIDDSELVNVVRCYGETSKKVPVVAVARRTTGPYGTDTLGERVFEFTSEAITTQSQAQNAANAGLRSRSGLVETIQVEAPLLLFVDEGDIVSISNELLQLEDDIYLVDHVDKPKNPLDPYTISASRRLG